MTYNKRWIGVDPGDRWMGLAVLTHLDGGFGWTADIRVVDLEPYNLTGIGNGFRQLFGSGDFVICEDFRMRAVGHQQFNAGRTLRTLGMFEYITTSKGGTFGLIPPDRPELVMESFFGPIIRHWRTQWMDRTSPHWGHALSAWRVLIHWLAKNNPKVIERIHKADLQKNASFITSSTEVFWPPTKDDHMAKLMVWGMR